MENTFQSEEELEKQEETEASGSPVQDQEQATTDAKGQIKQFQDDLAEARDKYLRLYAEFDNFRRRTSKERIDLIQAANENLITVLLPILDDFERAGKSMNKNDKSIEGFFLIESKFKKILENNGVKVMETKPGDDFDPEIHDAITQIPAPEEDLKGKIADIVEKGYVLNEKVIRHAKVVIGN